MQVHVRPFRKDIYDLVDEPSKKILSDYLISKGHTIVEDKETFDADIVSTKDGFTYFNEVEVKSSWKDEWPDNWAEIRIPGRKRRLVEKYKDHFVHIHELGLKHLPNPEKLWKSVSSIYTEEWLSENWGKIKPTPIDNIQALTDGYNFKLEEGRTLTSLYSPGHAKHHYTFYDNISKTIFMGDTLGLIYPHGNFVQPNLPPPDFNRETLIDTLENIASLELEYVAIAHFGIHSNPYELINNAIDSIDQWVSFMTKIPELSNEDAAKKLEQWVLQNYKSLNIEERTITNYMENTNFDMQVWGLRNSSK